MLQNRVLPKTVNFDTLNPNINIEKSNVVIQTEETKLEKNGSLHGLVSSFGFSGTLGHILLRESTHLPTHTYTHPFTQRKTFLSAEEKQQAETTQNESTPFKTLLEVHHSGKSFEQWLKETLTENLLHKLEEINGKMESTYDAEMPLSFYGLGFYFWNRIY